MEKLIQSLILKQQKIRLNTLTACIFINQGYLYWMDFSIKYHYETHQNLLQITLSRQIKN